MALLGSAPKLSNRAPVRMWLYGDPDAGKTHFAVQFPKPLLISTDGNYIYERVPANSVDAWEAGSLAKPEEKARGFVNIVQELKKINEFETVIVDLIEGVQRLARGYFLKTLNIVHESDLNYGKAYQTVNENFISQIEQLFKLPLNVIIISHQTTETIKPKNGAEYTIFKPKLDDKYHSTLEGYCNLVSRVYVDVDSKGREVRKLSLTIKSNEYGINRLGQVDDLILVHNGDNYTDFMRIWQELYDRRGLGLVIRDENIARKDLETTKDEQKKDELLAATKKIELEREAAKAASTEAANAETKTEKTSTTVTKSENKAETAAEKIARLKQQAKNKTAGEAKITPVVKEEVVKTVDEPKAPAGEPIEDTHDDEPTVVRTESTNEKLKRIAELKRQAQEKNKK